MVTIDDTYIIDVSGSPISYTLKRVYTPKPKDDEKEQKERYRVLGYYSTVEGVLHGLVEQVVADDLSEGLYSLREAYAHICEQRERLERIISEAFNGSYIQTKNI